MSGILSHNKGVRLRRTIWGVTLLALFAFGFAPRAVANWQCEGRTCGTTVWACCCALPDNARDENCGRPGGRRPSEGACASECGCILVVQAVCRATAARIGGSCVSLIVPSFVAPASPAVELPEQTVVARLAQSRGPPPVRISFVIPSLRAPPAA